MFSRTMTVIKTDIYDIGDVNDLIGSCERYIELDKIIFGNHNKMMRKYYLNPIISSDSFSVAICMKLWENTDDIDGVLYLNYDTPSIRKFEITTETAKDISENVLKEFCNLHEELFGVPVTVGYSGWSKEHTYLSFNSLNKDDSQN